MAPPCCLPAEHVEEFCGPLPAAALADIYAGRRGGGGEGGRAACDAAAWGLLFVSRVVSQPCHCLGAAPCYTAAGRHERVPAAVLEDATHWLKYSYGVYSLEPKSEAQSW